MTMTPPPITPTEEALPAVVPAGGITGETTTQRIPQWQCNLVMFAGIYNIVWGTMVIAAPALIWNMVGAPVPEPLALWQGLGAIIGAFGLGFLVAARDPHRHWLIIAVAALAKTAGTVGFFWAAFRGDLPWSFGWWVLVDDFAWIIPFAIIVRSALTTPQAAARW
jgi:small multidrug resistance pump